MEHMTLDQAITELKKMADHQNKASEHYHKAMQILKQNPITKQIEEDMTTLLGGEQT